MKSKLFIILFFAIISNSFSQQLTYKNGRVFNSENKKLSPTEVREILDNTPQQLYLYNTGRTKATAGGVFLGLGAGLMIADIAGGASADRVYPGAATYIGVAFLVVSIPILIGNKAKVKSAIDGYNKSLTNNSTSFVIEKINFISNNNGVGMQVSF